MNTRNIATALRADLAAILQLISEVIAAGGDAESLRAKLHNPPTPDELVRLRDCPPGSKTLVRAGKLRATKIGRSLFVRKGDLLGLADTNPYEPRRPRDTTVAYDEDAELNRRFKRPVKP